ncbi:hypothetical protein D9M69_659550 [compost metagenome]
MLRKSLFAEKSIFSLVTKLPLLATFTALPPLGVMEIFPSATPSMDKPSNRNALPSAASILMLATPPAPSRSNCRK